ARSPGSLRVEGGVGTARLTWEGEAPPSPGGRGSAELVFGRARLRRACVREGEAPPSLCSGGRGSAELVCGRARLRRACVREGEAAPSVCAGGRGCAGVVCGRARLRRALPVKLGGASHSRARRSLALPGSAEPRTPGLGGASHSRARRSLALPGSAEP